MKILHLHSNKEWGGGEEQILLLAQGLVKKGVMVEICSPGEGLLFQRAHEVGIDVSDFNHISLGALEGVMVHAHDSASLKAAQKTNRPIVYTRRIMSPLRKSIFSKLKYSPKRIHQMVAISETVKQVLVEGGYPSDKIKVVQDALDLELIESILPVTSNVKLPVIAGLGKLAEKKNWGFFIAVMAELKSRGQNLRSFIAGEGSEHASLMAQIKALDLVETVELLGFRYDALELLKGADVLLFPSLAEGASVTIRQAMAMKVPVVCLTTPGCVESIGDTGWLVEKGDVSQAADYVEEILRDSAEVREKVQKSYQAAKDRFAGTAYVDEMMGVYHKMWDA